MCKSFCLTIPSYYPISFILFVHFSDQSQTADLAILKMLLCNLSRSARYNQELQLRAVDGG